MRARATHLTANLQFGKFGVKSRMIVAMRASRARCSLISRLRLKLSIAPRANNTIRAGEGGHLTFQVAYTRNIGTRHLQIERRTRTSTGGGKDGYVIRDCYVNTAVRLRAGTQGALLDFLSAPHFPSAAYFRVSHQRERRLRSLPGELRFKLKMKVYTAIP